MKIYATLVALLLASMQLLADSPKSTSGPAPTVQTEFVFEARVTVDKPLVIGESSHGLRRIVPITGGTVEGPKLTGRIVPGGADWQYVRPDGVLDIQAKYTLETEDGVLIMVDNRGLRHASAAVMERLTKGEPVSGNEYYFRTSAQFEAPKGSKYEWLNRAIFIGVADRLPNAAIIRFYQVK